MQIGILNTTEYLLRRFYFQQSGIYAVMGSFNPDLLQINVGPETSQLIFSQNNFIYSNTSMSTMDLKKELFNSGLTEDAWQRFVTKSKG